MASRRELLRSHRYAGNRTVAALVTGDADPAQPVPGGRAGTVALAGLLAAVIGVGGAAAYGAVGGSARQDWRDGRAIIVERESGVRYVFRDGLLHPVHNYSSAALLVASAPPRTVLVSRDALRSVPRGALLGIQGAPDSLPQQQDLLDGAWTVCTGTTPAVSAATGPPASVVQVGVTSAANRPLGEDGLLVQTPDGAVALLWRGRRHGVPEPQLVRGALGWGQHRPLPVATAFLRAVPAGAELVGPTVPGVGDRSSGVPGARVGEVFVVATQSGSRQYAVAVRDGLAQITQVQADLLLTSHDQAVPTPLTQGRFRALAGAGDLTPSGSAPPPATTPRLREAAKGRLCVRIAAPDAPVEIDLDPSGPSGPAAGGVQVPPGRAALVRAVSAGDGTAPASATASAPAPALSPAPVSLVTETGVRHEVTDPATLAVLGYPDAVPVPMPADVVGLVPAGPALDARAALR
ncbi:type VII secretion protein EccB [Solwaraspora sp. WMMA2056]|uniref:type VII secretion protein EccB n=1 Tax=Solwaraspora sp. WMMA2056 TaxID=3015161 RepID=UPI00259B4EE9|nr:type VII secretion protein EccB [Solwaraspora sp. WMMA2056]WJK42002.1 type VII secretion protein EccB [Solwaraspora sp. WMMA2056]